jgi:hypothetical protein
MQPQAEHGFFLMYSAPTDSDIIWRQADGGNRGMISSPSFFLRRIMVVSALCAAALGLTCGPAQARVFVGLGFGLPLYYGPGYYPPPVYYPPPIYYAPPPPPVYYVPPQTYTPGATARAGGQQSCYAGAYVCPMERPVAAGASCYCLGNGGQKVWGRAN